MNRFSVTLSATQPETHSKLKYFSGAWHLFRQAPFPPFLAPFPASHLFRTFSGAFSSRAWHFFQTAVKASVMIGSNRSQYRQLLSEWYISQGCWCFIFTNKSNSVFRLVIVPVAKTSTTTAPPTSHSTALQNCTSMSNT